MYKEYSWANRHSDRKEDLYRITEVLFNADEYVPLDAHYDWFEALERAMNSYRCKKIAEALPMALEQYQMNIQMIIAFPKTRSGAGVRAIWLENILSGRRLNGEPNDLDF